MLMLLQKGNLVEIIINIPNFNFSLVGCRDNVRFAGVNDDGSDEVIMRLELLNFLHSVVIKNTDYEIIGAANNPLLLHDKSDCPDGIDRRFYCTDTTLCVISMLYIGLIVVEHYCTRIQTIHHPRIIMMEIKGFHSRRSLQ